MIEDAVKRMENLKMYIIRKIQKRKLKFSLFLHRTENWVVSTVKSENDVIYDFVGHITNFIKNAEYPISVSLPPSEPRIYIIF